jgi:hypothetical protein
LINININININITITNRNLYNSEVEDAFRRGGSIGASNNKKTSESLAFL